MIMQWKKQGSDYHAHWQGINFVLTEHPTTKRWQCLANSKHVKQDWRSLHAAIADIEARQEKLVVQASKERMTGGSTSHNDILERVGGRVLRTSAEAREELRNGASVRRETSLYEGGACKMRFVSGSGRETFALAPGKRGVHGASA